MIDRYVFKRLARSSRRSRVLAERLTEPLHLNLVSAFVALFGSFRSKVNHDLIIRQQFAFPILHAADKAREAGLKKLTLVEFGVANGAGLLNMCRIAVSVTKVTGVEFEVFGFDTGSGMPAAVDYRDHPEMFQQNDFPMDVERLNAALPPFASLVLGNVADTVPAFLAKLSPRAPLAFVSMDLDYYSSTKTALEIFNGAPEHYLQAALLYLDDTVIETANPWCGELLAINEFNDENEHRKIAPFPMLRSRRLFKNPRWIEQIYLVHIMDHPLRTPGLRRPSHVIPNEYTN
ncbi:MAG: hypothetical protein KGJ53_01065 [Alphaproteobacteria bacterium]|nr:hypothetical protein [Alphaproteobacteria bacterium]MDE2161723.1 hypothetical protein [Alphaproteobacteria bacterium]